jgi:glycosyltransferase involved in cell wall biosynthesis
MKHGTDDSAHVLVVSLDPADASSTLFFGHLADRLGGALRIVKFGIYDVGEALATASAVILVRGLFEFGNLIECARRLGVPCYYFLDDNFMVLREEPGGLSFYGPYTDDRVRDALRHFSGVLLPGSLIEYFREHRLHDRLMEYPPIAGPALDGHERSAGSPLTIAFFGGQHRRAPLVRWVYPAVCRLGENRKVRLIMPGTQVTVAPSAGVEVVNPPYDPSYTSALKQMARYGVDILVHPSSATANNPYKNPHVLINAHALGAAPIFSAAPPYDSVARDGVAIVAEDDDEHWYRALLALADDPKLRRQMLGRIAVYCEERFSGRVNADVIKSILRSHAVPSARTRIGRRLAATACLAAGSIGRTARRIRRRLTAIR